MRSALRSSSGSPFLKVKELITAMIAKVEDEAGNTLTYNKEHEREVKALYREELELCEKLARIVNLTQSEIVPREKTMHALIEKMCEACEAVVNTLHSKVGDHLDAVERHKGLLQSMEDELRRIRTLLGHELRGQEIVTRMSRLVLNLLRRYCASDAAPQRGSR